jgi:peptidyl-prolyl cis-trans isomerase-like protein 2
MGKNQHSKDRMFITATEWATQYGGKKRKASGANEIRPLPFDHCALSLAPFTSPCMFNNNTGVIFEYDNIIPYLKKHKSDPVSGDPMTESDIIRLHMDKNSDGEWQCPITNKVFTGSSHIVAIRTSGNVYSYNAIEELNLKPKFFNDLIDGSKFTRADIVTIQDPQNPDIMAKHDISTFKHLQQVREDSTEARKSESKLRHSVASEGVMREIAKQQQEEKESGTHKRTTEEILRGQADVDEDAEDVSRFKALNPLVEDVNPGQTITDGKASISLTSTSTNSQTKATAKYATTEDIREAKWKIMRKVNGLSFSFYAFVDGIVCLAEKEGIRTNTNFVR